MGRQGMSFEELEISYEVCTLYRSKRKLSMLMKYIHFL